MLLCVWTLLYTQYKLDLRSFRVSLYYVRIMGQYKYFI